LKEGNGEKKRMKGLCYIMIFLVIIMLFSKSPIIGLIIVGTFITIWLFTKVKKKDTRSTSKGFFFGNRKNQATQSINDFITFMMVQQMFNISKDDLVSDKLRTHKKSENHKKQVEFIEQQKQKILKLFEE
jgi:hypothetical protein